MGKNLLVTGLQWGDEGKGKIIDVLSRQYDAVVRFQGGANAGHTVHVGEEKFVLHLVPSGILHPEKQCIIANGVVVDPECLTEEIEALKARGCDVDGRLWISDRCHVVMPYHKMMDGLQEAELGDRQIQTTRRGIGPCYADKAARTGIRFGELVDPEIFRPRLRQALDVKNRILTRIHGADPIDFDDVWDSYHSYAERLKPFVRDTVDMLHGLEREGKSLLLEGAQGAMLDINFGTYPYVTSSNVCSGGATVGAGLPPSSIDDVLGIVKAYCTRVGGGPFPTEQDNEVGAYLREKGNEYGSTTGRARRCGWLDAVALNYTVRVNGVSSLSLMLMDVLSGLPEIRICTGYRTGARTLEGFPSDAGALERVEPVYESFKGWEADIADVKRFDQLPEAAMDYVAAIESLTGTQVKMVSVGPKRSQLILRD